MNRHRLSPTLWRTCRVLANATRLGVLDALMRDSPMHVGRVMAVCRLGQPQASRHLRALQARGLLTAHPQGRYMFFSAAADPSVDTAAPLLDALSGAARRKEPAGDRIRALTAYTHPRRIALVQELARGSASVVHLQRVCRISVPAAQRHLAKLRLRGVVEPAGRGVYRLAAPQGGLSRLLLALACGSAQPRRR